MAFPRRLELKAWKRGYAPGYKDHVIEEAWLNDHGAYGASVHEVTSRALVKALAAPTTREEAHALYFKLFAEFANVLEVAGALGWVIRTRREHGLLLLDAFLTYPQSAPRDFFAAARRNRSGSLIHLLRLPSERKVVRALCGAPDLTFTEAEARLTLVEGVDLARLLAAHYFGEDEIIRATYNRLKHGATMLYDESLPERQFYVIAPHLTLRGGHDRARYDMPRLTVSRESVEDLGRNIQLGTGMLRYFAALASALRGAGLLYPPHRRTRSRLNSNE